MRRCKYFSSGGKEDWSSKMFRCELKGWSANYSFISKCVNCKDYDVDMSNIKEDICCFEVKSDYKEILSMLIEYEGKKLHKSKVFQYFVEKYKDKGIPFYVYGTLQEMSDEGLIIYKNNYVEGISPSIYKKRLERIPDRFEKIIEELYYMTSIDNLQSIIQNGILSHNRSRNIEHRSIANVEVQQRREKICVDDLPLHDYANLYFAKKTPMQYSIKDRESEICFICIENKILLLDGVYFSDGNAASDATNFYNDLNNLDKVPWDVIRASYWSNYKDGKRRRNAEVLVPHEISPKYFIRIVVSNEKMYKDAKDKIDGDIKIDIDRNFYFRRR
jgi:hypothetical protein